MKITEINIDSFGKLKHFSVNLTDGVNIIYGENESGKSTLMEFIKAMFYGLGVGAKRRRYEPWDGGQMGGSIEFEHEERVYLLHRTFGATKAGDRLSLFNKSIGEEVMLPAGQEPGVFILGLNIKSFLNTMFIGQLGAKIDGDSSEIIAKLTNLTTAGDEQISKGEVEKRLKKGAASLDSKKSSAILPELRKQKHELLEARSEMQKQLTQANVLREEIATSAHRRRTLTKKKEFLAQMNRRLAMKAELEDIDRIIEKHCQMEELQAKFDELDALFGGDEAENMENFLANAKELIEAEKSQQIVIAGKQEQMEELKKASEQIDRSKLAKTKFINKHQREIASAFERYDSLTAEKSEIELVLEQREQQEETENADPTMLFVGCGAAILVVTLLLGALAHWGFYFAGGIALVSLIAYVMVYRRNIAPSDQRDDERINLANVEEDLRALNAEMRPILEQLGVSGMMEFDREYKEIERVQHQALDIRTKKEDLQRQLDELNAELDSIRSSLRESLSVYREVSSNEEAFDIISRLDKCKGEHDKIGAELNAAAEALVFMLNGRDYAELTQRAEQLRSDSNLELPENLTAPKLQASAKAVEQQLDEIKTLMTQQETELSLQPYSPQDLDAITDEIKLLNQRIEHYEFELEAIQEAESALDEAFDEMRMDFGPMINYRAGRVLSGITNGKYHSVFVSENLTPSVAEAGSSAVRSCEVLSTGTYDQVYLSLRLALSGVMSDENLPVLLDDAFAQFDDSRTELAMSFLKEDNEIGELGQIILFTCHKRILHTAKKLDMVGAVFSMELAADRVQD